MKDQKGVTLVALVTTIIVLAIVLSITTSSSITTYKNMRLETFRSELEEISSAVDKMYKDYNLAKQSDSSITDIKTYLNSKYSSAGTTTFTDDRIISGTIATSKSAISNLTTRYPDLASDSAYSYYFSQSDIKKCFGLDVTLNDGIVVDFAKRNVYSLVSVKDPDDDTKLYYSLVDSGLGGSTSIQSTAKSSLTGVNISSESGVSTDSSTGVNSTKLINVGNSKLLKITLKAVRDTSGNGENYPLKAYYTYGSGTEKIDVKYLGDYEYNKETDEISFVVYNSGTYNFSLTDTFLEKNSTAPFSVSINVDEP